jgi:pimeloyl-ACP methyl ester carboxylesterase
MSGTRTPGPYSELDLGDVKLPLWIIPFDAKGGCTGPQTRKSLIEAVAGGGYTHAFVFSHGWNNTFDQAVANYECFVNGYHELVQTHALKPPPLPYRPLLIGIYWPSIDLVLPWEKAPKIAGVTEASGPDPMDLDYMVREAERSVDHERATKIGELAGRIALTEAEAREFAAALSEAYPSDDELGHAGSPDADDLMQTWSDLVKAGQTEDKSQPAGPESFGVARADRAAADPQAAGWISSLTQFDPRDVLRAFTVYKMKDRAGRVGATGGASLLRDLLTASRKSRFHLIGHSYGARLLLSAICSQPLPRSVRSLLLLEPAVNYLCFAKQVPKIGRPGGFRAALSRVEEPILTTFSSHDVPLHDFFHIAVRRRSDLGEIKVGALGVVPSIYAALGGWGPGLDPDEVKEVPLARFPDRYVLDAASYRVYALNGESGIHSHSDVINESTFWALYNQVTV